ncbi:hypothetical protein MCAMS1_00703 [biofilm metagenome]
MWFIYLSLALQIYFGIHAIKTGRPFVWVLVIILTSVLGCLAYVVIELLPEWLATRKGQQVKKAIGMKVDPEKDLKAAQETLHKVDTVNNRIHVAEEFVKLNRFAQARELYARCLSGPHAEDPQIMLAMAKVEFGLNNFSATVEMLDKLKAANPNFKSPEGHLLYARSLEGMGRVPEAINEYEVLSNYYSTPEPACRLAQIYQTQGNKTRANELFQSVIKRSATAGQVFNEVNQNWIKLAKKEVGSN